MDVVSEVARLDPEILAGVARRALCSETAEVVGWSCEPLAYAVSPMAALWSDGVYRVAGVATNAGREARWSTVLKTYHSPAGRPLPNGSVVPKEDADDETQSHYWRREPLAYASGLLEDLPGAISAPRYLGVTELPDEHCWVWLEDVGGADVREWPLERYRLTAAHLGSFNGAYLSTRQLPDLRWLSHKRLRRFLVIPVEGILGSIRSIQGAWEHPVVREAFPPQLAGRLLRLWQEREVFLSVLERMPQVLSHLDAFRGNLFGRGLPDGGEETVAIDWTFMGIAPLGEELAPLIVGSVLTNHVSIEDLPGLEEMALDGYCQGLREAGWDGQPDLVWASYAACAMLRYGLVTSFGLVMAAHNEDMHALMTQGQAASFEAQAYHSAALTLHLIDGLDRARPMLGLT